MYSQIKIVGWMYIILGISGTLAAFCTAVLIFAGGLISSDETAITVTGIIALVVVGLSILISIPGIITGIGLLRLKRWARILAMVLAIFSLPAFPVGTLLGIYVLYVMFDSDTVMLFDNPTIDN